MKADQRLVRRVIHALQKLVCIDRSNLGRPRGRWTEQNSRRRKKPQMAYVVLLLLIIKMMFKPRSLLLIPRGLTLNFLSPAHNCNLFYDNSHSRHRLIV